MNQLEKRICNLEARRPATDISLAHVPDDALDRMEEILGRSPLALSHEEAAFFHSFGLACPGGTDEQP